MTHREARRKLGSRTNRRSNTSGKVIAGRPAGKNAKAPCRRFPRKASRKNAVAVERLVRNAQAAI